MLRAAIGTFQMIKLGLLGRNISHSRSKEIYENILRTEVDYYLFDFQVESEIPDLASLFKGLDGLSITTPYKKTFIGQKSTELKFKSYPAVNCVHQNQVTRGFELYNTDYLAVIKILKKFESEFGKRLQFVILGDGNMAHITSIALKDLGHDFQMISRSKLKADLNSLDYFSLFSRDPDQKVLINCCSREFIFKAAIPNDLVFWDHNYSLQPHEQELAKTCDYRDGLELLKLQAYEALKLWGFLS